MLIIAIALNSHQSFAAIRYLRYFLYLCFFIYLELGRISHSAVLEQIQAIANQTLSHLLDQSHHEAIELLDRNQLFKIKPYASSISRLRSLADQSSV
jgi:hypothetical protein